MPLPLGRFCMALIILVAAPTLGPIAASAAQTQNVAQATTTAPKPTATPLSIAGKVRSYYFTRQNASNYPGVSKGSNAVNQASLNNAFELHADYRLGAGWYVGGTYFYANPLDGPCAAAWNHSKATSPSPGCVSQVPPSTNPDDTLPGFGMSTLYEAYVGYKSREFSGKVGNQLFNSPWAAPVDTRVKPAAFQGGDFVYTTRQNWVFEGADMIRFEPRTSSAFINSTLLTSFPAGNNGIPSNVYSPGGVPITTAGFTYTHIGYDPKSTEYANAYLYNVTNLLNIFWLDGRYTWQKVNWQPYVAIQGGTEANAGSSYLGKIDAQLYGIQLGGNATKNVVVSVSFIDQPWHTDTVLLPKGVSCSNSTHQISAKGVTFGYFLPLNAGQCLANANGTTNVYYGGWASPYTDNYATNPEFTTSISQGTADRRAPATSWRVAATYTSTNKRFVLIAGDASYNYGNAVAAQTTTEWNLDGTYRFSPVFAASPYHGLQIRYRYAQRTYTNTFCGAPSTSCAAATLPGTTVLGGQPLFKYNRAMVEYDF